MLLAVVAAVVVATAHIIMIKNVVQANVLRNAVGITNK